MDAFLLARLARELARDWAGAWIQGVWQDEAGRLVLRLRRPGQSAHLILSAHPAASGIGLLDRRPPCPSRPPALAAYLRAHAEGGRLGRVCCEPFERVVELSCSRPDGGAVVFLEATGRRANLLVTDPGKVLRAAARWEGPEQSALRPLQPGQPYRPPPLLDRLPPTQVAREDLEAWSTSEDPRLQRRVQGFSPTLAGEVLYRARTSGFWGAFRSVADAYGKEGPVWEYADGLSAVELTRLGPALARHERGLEPAGTWLEAALSRSRSSAASRGAERTEAAAQQRRVRRAERIQTDLERLPCAEDLRADAEALAAHLHEVARGAVTVTVPDPRRPGDFRELRLEPALGPGENLDRLFRKARQVERTRAILLERLAEARAAPPPSEAPAEPSAERGKAPSGPFRRYRSSDGWAIWVGRNGAENDRLVREARPWDLWFHARDGAGAHVLVRKPGREARAPERTLLEAAGLAAFYSRQRGEGAVEVMVAEASRVHKPKGAGRGRVVVAGERTLRVAPGAGNPRPL